MTKKNQDVVGDNETRSNPNAEKALVANVFLDNNTFYPLRSAFPDSSDFFNPIVRKVFNGMKDLVKRQEEKGETLYIDPILVADRMAQADLKTMGGVATITNLTYGIPHLNPKELNRHIELVKKEALARKYVDANNRATGQIYERDNEVETVIDTHIAELTQLKEKNTGNQTIFSAKDAVNATIKLADDRVEAENRFGILFGIPEVDARLGLGQLELGDVTVYVADSGVGKTVVMTQVFKSCGFRKIPGLYHALEMPKERLLKRMAAEICGIPNKDLNEVTFRQNNKIYQKYKRALAILAELPIYFDEGSFSIEEITAADAYMSKTKGIKIAFGDYTQKIIPRWQDRKDSRDRQISAILEEAKNNAMKFGIHNFYGAQLQIEAPPPPGTYRPIMKMRESAGGKHNADNLIYGYATVKDLAAHEEDESKLFIHWHFKKQREGSDFEIGSHESSVRLCFEKDFQRIMSPRMYVREAELGGFDKRTDI